MVRVIPLECIGVAQVTSTSIRLKFTSIKHAQQFLKAKRSSTSDLWRVTHINHHRTEDEMFWRDELNTIRQWQ